MPYTRTDAVGSIYYYNDNNQLHRDNGPAVEWRNGNKSWYQYSMRHRTDGPAVYDFRGYHDHYLFGKYFNKIDYQGAICVLEKTPNQRWRKF